MARPGLTDWLSASSFVEVGVIQQFSYSRYYDNDRELLNANWAWAQEWNATAL